MSHKTFLLIMAIFHRADDRRYIRLETEANTIMKEMPFVSAKPKKKAKAA